MNTHIRGFYKRRYLWLCIFTVFILLIIAMLNYYYKTMKFLDIKLIVNNCQIYSFLDKNNYYGIELELDGISIVKSDGVTGLYKTVDKINANLKVISKENEFNNVVIWFNHFGKAINRDNLKFKYNNKYWIINDIGELGIWASK